MEVAAVAGQVRERLGHERRDQPALLGERLDHVAEEDSAVAGRQRVGEREVLLELAVGVLVIGGVVVPAELGHGVRRPSRRSRGCGSARACRNRAARACRAGRRPRSRRPRCGAAGSTRARRRSSARSPSSAARASASAQDRARAERPRLALDRDVAREAGDVRLPRAGSSASRDRGSRSCRGRAGPGRCRRPRSRRTRRRRTAGRRDGGPGRASRSACRACRRTGRTGTRCRCLVDDLARTSSAFVGGVCMCRRYTRDCGASDNGQQHPDAGG